MSVVGESSIVPRAWRGFDDPSYPVGMYVANFVVIGDVTGGNMTVIFPFKEDGIPASGRLYNIEQISVFTSLNIDPPLQGFIRVLGFDSVGPFIIGERNYRFDILGGSSVISSGTNFPPMPLFLGHTGRLEGTSSEIQIGTTNVVAVLLSADIQGYIWEPRSILAEGGLKRPADILYGR